MTAYMTTNVLLLLLLLLLSLHITDSFHCHYNGHVALNRRLLVKDNVITSSPYMRRSHLQLVTKENTAAVTDNNGMSQEEIEEEAMIKRIEDEVMAESGVELDQLINPSKVVNLERDLIKLNAEMLDTSVGQEELNKIQTLIDKKKAVLFIEKRAVMRGWLKNLFVGQSVLAGIISYGMVYNNIPGYDAPLAIQVLGFWMWWLFIIPSLRARKPQANEKEALNIAFILSPTVSLLLPTFTKDVTIIWWANAIATAACYAYAYLIPKSDDTANANDSLPPWLKQAFKALDFGSGQERGLRK